MDDYLLHAKRARMDTQGGAGRQACNQACWGKKGRDIAGAGQRAEAQFLWWWLASLAATPHSSIRISRFSREEEELSKRKVLEDELKRYKVRHHDRLKDHLTVRTRADVVRSL